MDDKPTQPIASVPTPSTTQQPTQPIAPVMDVVAPPRPPQPTAAQPQQATQVAVEPKSEAMTTEAVKPTEAAKPATAKEPVAKSVPKQDGAPVGAILFAVFVLIALSALTVMVYQKG